MAKKEKKKVGGLLTLSAIRKKYPNSKTLQDIDLQLDNTLRLPSRVLTFNYQLGGGIPYGHILELYGEENIGKTLMAMDFGYSAQQLGGIVLWDDAEGTFSPRWAKQNGLNLSRVEHMEVPEAKQIETLGDWQADMIVYYRSQLKNNEPILLVIDSIAALDTIENLMTAAGDKKAEMGRRAKAMDEMLRTRGHFYKKYGVCVIFINQLRKKIGAGMFEDPDCLHGNTIVPLTDGRSFPIREIYEKNIKGNVWSWNEDFKQIEEKPISVSIRKEELNPNFEKWYSVITNGPGSKGGNFGGIFTGKHGLLTDKGWRNTETIIPGDKLLSRYKSIINGTLQCFLYGSFIGDSSLRLRTTNTARYQLQDNENPEYLKWKLSKLEPFMKFKKIEVKGRGYKYQSEYTVELQQEAKRFKKRDPLKALNTTGFDVLTLAVWYMDDGHLSGDRQMVIGIARYRSDLIKLCYQLSGQGYTCEEYGRGIRFTAEGGRRLSQDIRRYIPDSMQYKLLPQDRGYYEDFILFNEPIEKKIWVEVKSIKEAGERNYRHNYKYDLTIEDNHNFIAGGKESGFIVHNTTPGGQAMKYYASLRVGLYGGKILRDDKKQRYGRVAYSRVKKTKVGIPRDNMQLEVIFRQIDERSVGYSKYAGLMEILVSLGVVKRVKSRFYFKDKMIANGEDKMNDLLLSDEDLRRKLIRRSKINTISRTQGLIDEIKTNLYPVAQVKAKKQTEDDEE